MSASAADTGAPQPGAGTSGHVDPAATPTGPTAPVNRRQGLRGAPRITLDALLLVRRAAPRALAGAVLLQVVSAVLLGGQLYVVRALVSALVRVAREGSLVVGDVVPSFVALVVLGLASGVVAALADRSQRMLAELVSRATLDQIVEVASSVDLQRFEDPAFHDQMERATNAAAFRPVEMVNAVMTLFLGMVTSIVVAVALVTIEPLLVPFILVASVPVLLATLYNSKRSYAFEYGMTAHARERFHLLELFVGDEPAKELRAFGAAPYLRRRFDALSDERLARMRAFLGERLGVAVMGVVAGVVGTAAAVAALVWLLSSGRLTVAGAATAAVAMQVLAGRLSAMTSSVGRLVESGLFLDDLQKFLRYRVALPPAEVHVPPPAFEHLEVRGLSFAYPGTEGRVLEDVSLEVGKGQVVALVGENGSGKTTLVKVLAGLYPYADGSVRWNGEELSDVPAERLRSGMTILFQDFVRYHLTVADNIVLGRSDVPADTAAVEAAAAQARALELVARLPNGYDTRLGREFAGGQELSGGQWQRLALARSFYRGGDFLILDEPTAALDPRAERALFDQIRELAAGKSVLLISHRFANVRTADRIHVMHRGRVAESGTHDELIANDGLYAELFALQATAYVDGA